MTSTIYLEDKLDKQLRRIARNRGQARNALIREAVRDWVAKQCGNTWPPQVLAWKGIKSFPRFESHRAGLLPPPEDPLG